MLEQRSSLSTPTFIIEPKKLAGTKCCACIFLDHNFTEIKSKIQNIYLIYLEITFIIIEKNVYLQML